METILKAFWQEEDGQDMVEYSLLLAFIAIAAIGLLVNVKGSISTLWGTIDSQLTNANAQASAGAGAGSGGSGGGGQ